MMPFNLAHISEMLNLKPIPINITRRPEYSERIKP